MPVIKGDKGTDENPDLSTSELGVDRGKLLNELC